MKLYLLLLLLIIFMVPTYFLLNNKPLTPDEIEIKIFNEWMYAFQITNLSEKSEVIIRPPGVWKLIFKITIPSANGFQSKIHCTYYQVPYKKMEGKLKIVEIQNQADCPLVPGDNFWLELNGLSNFRVKYSNFNLLMNFQFNHQEITWVFPFYNIDQGVIHEKFQPLKERSLFSGMKILRLNAESFDQKKISRLTLMPSTICRKVDSNCEQLGDDQCDRCLYGWYEVVNPRCLKMAMRICGPNHCGDKNMPSSPLGQGTGKEEEREDAGICQGDLGLVVGKDNILFCQ